MPTRKKEVWSPQSERTNWNAKQFQVLVQNSPLGGFASLLVVGLMIWLAQERMGFGSVLLWCLPLIISASIYTADSLILRRSSLSHLGSPHVRRRFIVYATLQGITWGTMCIAIYPHLDREGQLLLGLIAAGALPVGAITVATVAEVGLAWVLTLTPLLLVPPIHQQVPRYLLHTGATIVMGAIAIVCVITISRGMRARLIAESEARQDRQALGILLHDIESQSDDWAWGIDAVGRLAHAAPALTEALGGSVDQPLIGRSLLNLLAPRILQDDSQASLASLEEYLAETAPFRNLELCVQAGPPPESRRIWSMSGVPVRNNAEQVEGWRGVIRDVTVIRTQAEELNRLAHTDSLTGLTNRHILMETCAQTLEQIPATGLRANLIPLSLYLLDLDDFKSVNDTFGHATGDLLLQEIARRLQQTVSQHALTMESVLARLGGDEFALLLTRAHTSVDREVIGQELCAALRPSWITDTLRIDVRVSIGIASWCDSETRAERLLREADVALYEAKAAGRDQVRVYSADMGARVARRTALSKELGQLLTHHGRHGFEEGQAGELKVMYQPQVDLQTGQLRGTEALLRWHHPSRGQVSPAEFIPVAEDSGIIVPLGRWVMEQACRDAARWPEHLHVAVNVSGHQLAKNQLVPMVRETLRMTGLPAHRLELEITETALMSDPEEARAVLLDLRRLGVRIALDDFGTGYSSLAYLATLPVDVVKIDRSFVIAMQEDKLVDTVVESILHLCHALNLTTLAEGIEMPEQVARLRQHGCALGQGFLYDKALPSEAIAGWQARPAAAPGTMNLH